MVAALDDAFSHSSWEALQARLHDAQTPFTLTHGDFHAANMFLRHASGSGAGPCTAEQLVLVDWAEASVWEPTADLGQMMISDVKPEVRRGAERRMVEAYWRRLTRDGGVSAQEYPFKLCWSQYQRAGVERWLFLLPTLASLPGLPAKAMQYFQDQVAAFIHDHGRADGGGYLITSLVTFALPLN